MHSEQHPTEIKPKKRNTARLILLFLLSTVCLALSWQSDSTAFFIFFAFVPVYFLLNDRKLAEHDKPLLFILTFLSVFLAAWFGVYWIRNVDPTTHFVIALLRGITMLLPFGAAYLFLFSGRASGTNRNKSTGDTSSATSTSSSKPASKSTGGPTPIIVFIATWMIMEVLHDLNILGMSYGNLGHVLAAYPGMIQWYAITGSLGGTLWILLVNFVLFLLLQTMLKGIQRTTLFSLAALLPLIVSLIMFRTPANTTETNVNVIALHTSMDVYDYKYEVDPDELLNAYIATSKKYLDTSTTNIIFWPENAVMGDLFIDSLEISATVKKIREELVTAKAPMETMGTEEMKVTGTKEMEVMRAKPAEATEPRVLEASGLKEMEVMRAKELEVMVVTGAIIDQVTAAPDPGSYQPNILFEQQHDYHFKRYNTALFITREGAPQIKFKKRLVPMSEQVPMQRIFAPLISLVPNLADLNFSPAEEGYPFFSFGTVNIPTPTNNLTNPKIHTTTNVHTRPKDHTRPNNHTTPDIPTNSNTRNIPNVPTNQNIPTTSNVHTTPNVHTSSENRTSQTIRTTPIICYGSAFSTFTANEVLQTKSNFLAILLNEGWMKSEKAYRHFNWFAICRAIENRRFIVKSSNEGITTLIDSKGNTEKQLYGQTTGAVTGNLEINENLTFYTHYHRYIIYGILIAGFLVIIILALKIRRQDKKIPQGA
jgi:apolipoprotein N-acyltransferase